jgi:DNA-directed RNA polymerase delta subunit
MKDPKWKDLHDNYRNVKERNKFFDELTEMISKYTTASKREISDLMSFLKGHVEKYPEGIDFGPNNWMLRGRDIVMIDPFWPGYSKD